MGLKYKWGFSPVELLTTGLISAGGIFAIADGFRLLTQGPATAAWTGTYIIVAGLMLALFAGVALLPFNRRAAVSSVSNKVADETLEEAEEADSSPILEEEVPPDVARSLLLKAIILLLGWVLVLQPLGYIVATAAFLVTYGLLISRRRFRTTLIFAALTTAASALLFQAVGIQLPMWGHLF